MLLLTANTTGLSGISRLDLFAKTVVIEADQHIVSLVNLAQRNATRRAREGFCSYVLCRSEDIDLK